MKGSLIIFTKPYQWRLKSKIDPRWNEDGTALIGKTFLVLGGLKKGVQPESVHAFKTFSTFGYLNNLIDANVLRYGEQPEDLNFRVKTPDKKGRA